MDPILKETTRKLVYKYAEFKESENLTLQQLLEAIQTKTNSEKLVETSSESKSYYLINEIIPYRNNLTCGDMCLFSPGKHQEIIDFDPNKTSCAISAISPEKILNDEETTIDDEKEKREFLNGIMFFGVKDNHVIVSQSFLLQSWALEFYLNKLLKKFELISENNILFLRDQIDPNQIRRVQSANYIKLSAGLKTETIREGKGDEKEYHITPTGNVWNSFVAFLGEHAGMTLPEEIILTKRLSKERIKGEIILSFPRKRSDDDTPLIGDLATVLRNVDDIDYEIGLGKGGVLTKNKVKLVKSVSARMINGLIDRNQLFQHMMEWYHFLHRGQRILPS